MSSTSLNDMTVALAGIFQAAALVETIAKTGQLDSDQQRHSLESLFVASPETTISVYGNNINNLDIGLKAISESLSKTTTQTETLRYSLGILHLERQLRKRQDMLKVIGQRLDDCKDSLETFDLLHENTQARIASIYTDTISTFRFRIQVSGDYGYLQQPRIANQVRALLLSGIRAATLWHQVGGTRIKLLWQRKQIIETAGRLIQQQ